MTNEQSRSSHVSLSQNINHVIYSLFSLGLDLHQSNEYNVMQILSTLDSDGGCNIFREKKEKEKESRSDLLEKENSSINTSLGID